MLFNMSSAECSLIVLLVPRSRTQRIQRRAFCAADGPCAYRLRILASVLDVRSRLKAFQPEGSPSTGRAADQVRQPSGHPSSALQGQTRVLTTKDDAQHAWPRWGEFDIWETIHVLNYAAWHQKILPAVHLVAASGQKGQASLILHDFAAASLRQRQPCTRGRTAISAGLRQSQMLVAEAASVPLPLQEMHGPCHCNAVSRRAVNEGIDFQGQGWSFGTERNKAKNCWAAWLQTCCFLGCNS